MGALHKVFGANRQLDLRRGRTLELRARPLVMGVINVTPDSFSDGGQFLEPRLAVERGLRLIEEGADLLDLGAESTRPGGGVYGTGADPVTAADEIERLRPVIEGLREKTEIPLSVDTRKAEVARTALELGADIVNDVSSLGDPDMAQLLASRDAPVILMHSRGETRTMQVDIRFNNVVREVRDELESSALRAEAAGVRHSQILVDPGIGFGKTVGQNLQLLRDIDVILETSRPVVVGSSRKSFIAAVGKTQSDSRLGGSLASAIWAALRGVSILRVHDVLETAQFFTLWAALDGDST
jgi:dihydropteroate synthase